MPTASITSAFVEASEKLGFAFVPDFSVRLRDGRILETLGLVRDFGSKMGMLLLSEADEPSDEDRSELLHLGYVASVLFGTYAEYEESHFKATLDDWQFFGSDANCPAWYTGKEWS